MAEVFEEEYEKRKLKKLQQEAGKKADPSMEGSVSGESNKNAC